MRYYFSTLRYYFSTWCARMAKLGLRSSKRAKRKRSKVSDSRKSAIEQLEPLLLLSVTTATSSSSEVDPLGVETVVVGSVVTGNVAVESIDLTAELIAPVASDDANEANLFAAQQHLGQSVHTTADADFDNDQDVDAIDLGIWQTGYGSTNATSTSGDTDGDNDVDGADFLNWQRQFEERRVLSAEFVYDPVTSLTLNDFLDTNGALNDESLTISSNATETFFTLSDGNWNGIDDPAGTVVGAGTDTLTLANSILPGLSDGIFVDDSMSVGLEVSLNNTNLSGLGGPLSFTNIESIDQLAGTTTVGVLTINQAGAFSLGAINLDGNLVVTTGSDLTVRSHRQLGDYDE